MMTFMDKSWKDGPDILARGENGAAIAPLGLWISLRLLQITAPIAPVPFERVYITPDPLLQRQLVDHGAPLLLHRCPSPLHITSIWRVLPRKRIRRW